MAPTNNNISIKIGNVTLNSNDIPKDGIDLNKVDKNSKEILSCFNTDNDKTHLSATEIKHAISVFSSKDKAVKTDFGTIKKDGKLDEKELSNVKMYDTQQKRAKNIAEVKTAAEVLVKNMVREKMGLEATYNDNWAKDSSGAHYKWDGSKYKKEANVYFVAKDGSYKAKNKTNNKNAFIHTTYLPNGMPKSIQLKTADNKKAYTNQKYIINKVEQFTDIEALSFTGYFDIDSGEVGTYSGLEKFKACGWHWDDKENKFIRQYSADEQEMLCKQFGLKPENFR